MTRSLEREGVTLKREGDDPAHTKHIAMGIELFSDAELQAELKRREELAPIPVDEPSYVELRKTIIGGVEQAIKDKREDEDFEHYVYEVAITAVYGRKYWTWRNQQPW